MARGGVREGARESHLRLAGLAGTEGSIIVLSWRGAAEVCGEGITSSVPDVLGLRLAGLGQIYNRRLGLPGATEAAETTDEKEHYWNDRKPEIIPVYGNSKIVRPNVLSPFSQIIRGFSTK